MLLVAGYFSHAEGCILSGSPIRSRIIFTKNITRLLLLLLSITYYLLRKVLKTYYLFRYVIVSCNIVAKVPQRR